MEEERVTEERRRLEEEWEMLREKRGAGVEAGEGGQLGKAVKLLGEKMVESFGKLDASLKALEDSRSQMECMPGAPAPASGRSGHQPPATRAPSVGRRQTGSPSMAEVAADGNPQSGRWGFRSN